MSLRRAISSCCATLCLLAITACAPHNEFVIGAKTFTEQVILGELIAQHIEAKTGMKVQRRFYLAGSYICNQALISGRIDSYVEYTGTALTAILKQPVEKDPDKVLETVRRLYRERYGVVVTEPLGFENTFAMVVRGADAKRLHIDTLSQAKPYAPHWRLGVGYEFQERPDGLRGLQQAYGMDFEGSPQVMDLGLLYRVSQLRSGGYRSGKFHRRADSSLPFDRVAGRQALLSSLPGRPVSA